MKNGSEVSANPHHLISIQSTEPFPTQIRVLPMVVFLSPLFILLVSLSHAAGGHMDRWTEMNLVFRRKINEDR